MKAKPLRLIYGVGYEDCDVSEATHVKIRIPGPSGIVIIPVMLKGRREGTGNWTWNGDTEKPTLKPSVLTIGGNFRCHSWINDGEVKFLDDCSHDFAGKTLYLLNII